MPFIRPPFLERRKGFIREVVSFVEAADWSLNITIHLQSGLLSEVVFVERGHVRGDYYVNSGYTNPFTI